MPKPKTKKCSRCKGRAKPIDDFARSVHSKDGFMGVCRKCWSKALSKSKTKAKAARARGEAPPIRRKKANGDNGLDHANQALEKANGTKERFMVRAGDGDSVVYRSESKALKKAMEWKIAGHRVEVWRQCELELIARIRG